MFNFLKNIGTTEIIIIVLILLVLFGAAIMKKLARTSGETIRELKNVKNEFSSAMKEDDKGKGVTK